MSSVKYIVANYLNVLSISESTISEMLVYLEDHSNYPSLRSIVECFEAWQFKSTAATASIEQLKSVGAFFITFLNVSGGTFVFVIKVGIDYIIYLNSSGKVINDSYEEFESKWSHAVFVAEVEVNSGIRKSLPHENIISLKSIQRVSFYQAEPFTYKLFRRISIFFSYAFIRLGFRPNFISIMWMFVLLSASVIISFGTNTKNRLIVALLILLHFVLDCSDGEVARFTKTTSRIGGHFEQLIHWTTNLSMIAGISLGLFKQSGNSQMITLGLFCLISDSCFHFLYISLNTWMNENVDYGWFHKITEAIYFVTPLNTNLFLLGCMFNLLYLSLFSWFLISSLLFVFLAVAFFSKEFSILKKSK